MNIEDLLNKKLKIDTSSLVALSIIVGALLLTVPLFGDYGIGNFEVFLYDSVTKAPLRGYPVWAKGPVCGPQHRTTCEYAEGWKTTTDSTGRAKFTDLPAGEIIWYWVNPYGLSGYPDGGEYSVTLINKLTTQRTHYLVARESSQVGCTGTAIQMTGTYQPGEMKCSSGDAYKCVISGVQYLWQRTNDCVEPLACSCTSSTRCTCEAIGEAGCLSIQDCEGKAHNPGPGEWMCSMKTCAWKSIDAECTSNLQCDDKNSCTKDYCTNYVCHHTINDADADGVCDALDKCPYTPANTLTGCALTGCRYNSDCKDSDSCTSDICIGGSAAAGGGRCSNTRVDSDSDGVCDSFDTCPKIFGTGADGCPVTPTLPAPAASETTTPTTEPTQPTTQPTTTQTTRTTLSGYTPYTPSAVCYSGGDCNDNDECTTDRCMNGVCENKIVDVDGDGICDAKDKCPDEYGISKYNGCAEPIPWTLIAGAGAIIILAVIIVVLLVKKK